MNEAWMETPRAEPIADRDISLTFAKGMTVLKAFDAANTHLTLPQIARIAGLERATARRLVLTLVHLGYVKQRDRVFSLTPRILVLAGGFLQGRQFGKAIEPVLRAFSLRIGEPISMAMIDGYEGVYVAHAGSEKAKVSIGLTVGSRVPLLQTAIGRALVSHVGPDLTDEIVGSAPLRRYTSATVEDRDEIRPRHRAELPARPRLRRRRIRAGHRSHRGADRTPGARGCRAGHFRPERPLRRQRASAKMWWARSANAALPSAASSRLQ